MLGNLKLAVLGPTPRTWSLVNELQEAKKTLPPVSITDLEHKSALGKGSFGEVSLCFWRRGQLDVAVKANGWECINAEAIDNESKLLAVLIQYPHNNVVTVYGIVNDHPDRRVRLVMKYCASGSLDAYLGRLRLQVGVVRLPLAHRRRRRRWS